VAQAHGGTPDAGQAVSCCGSGVWSTRQIGPG
jgi:hypothetical protein